MRQDYHHITLNGRPLCICAHQAWQDGVSCGQANRENAEKAVEKLRDNCAKYGLDLPEIAIVKGSCPTLGDPDYVPEEYVPAKEENRVKPVCPKCGSDNVACDAAARWDADLQTWSLAGTHDCTTCQDCGYEDDVFLWKPLE
jgi:hypothetical protein